MSVAVQDIVIAPVAAIDQAPTSWGEIERDDRGALVLVVWRCRWCGRMACTAGSGATIPTACCCAGTRGDAR